MRRSFALLAVAALSACGNEIDQSTRPENIVGSYQLVSYGGPLPTTVQNDSVVVVVNAGNLVLAADRTWAESLFVTTTFRGGTSTTPLVSSGTWTQVRAIAYLAFNDAVNGYQFSGTAAGGSVVLETVSGRQLVYRR